MEHDTLARLLSAIRNAEKRGKPEVIAAPASRIIEQVLKLLKKEDYITGFEIAKGKKSAIRVHLNGTINNIGSIKPRYAITISDYERYESRYLPAKDFGRIIMSTSKGMMTHLDAKAKKLGGVLLAFVY